MAAVFVAALVALLPLTNPLGAVAAFAGLTGDMEPTQVRRQAVRTAVYVFVILAVSAVAGTLVLELFGISLTALQVAGGLVVAHAGFGMIVPREPLTSAEQQHSATKEDVSFSPMALPLIAGPGAIGAVIGVAARNPDDLADRGAIVAAAAVVALIIGLALRFGTPLVDRLGATGIGALMRVMGFLILAIGVEMILHGVLAAVRS